MTALWDVVVIGAGPAGLTAAETVARGGLRCVCIDRMGPGGVLINLGVLSDCHDLPAGTTGPDHIAALTERAMEAGVEIAIGEVQALRAGDHWTVATEDATYTTRAVIIATGLAPGGGDIEGAARFEGQGLSHCAACDGPLYTGAPVVVTGADKWALQEAIELAEMVGEVTLATGGAVLDATDPRVRRFGELTNLTIVPARVAALEGSDGLEAVVLEQAGQRSTVPARALFAYAGRRPALGFAEGLLALDADMRIRVDANLGAGASFLFAAGDVRAGSTESVAEAEADGRRAGQAALRALAG